MAQKPRILISAGHTSSDPGAIFKDLREADLNRDIAKRILPYLQKVDSIEVKAVPLDLQLFQRIEWINNTGYTKENNDVLVEIHVNDANGDKRGIEAWYEGNGDNHSQNLSALLLDELEKEFDYKSQGAKSEYDHELGMLTFLNRTKPAAAILEVLYLDNEEDIKILRDDQKLEAIAKNIALSILKYFGKDNEGKDLPEQKKPNFDDIRKRQVKSSSESKNRGAGGGLFGGLSGFGGSPSKDSDSNDRSSGFKPPSFGRGSGSSSIFGGGNNASSPSLGGGSSFGSGNSSSSDNVMMDREQRKKMIEEYYVKALGRKPKKSDLNFFLNRGTSEQELLKKIINSQEHVDLVKSKTELEELKEKHEKQSDQLSKLKTSMRDMKAILDSLNNLIIQKNKAIKHLENLIQDKHGVPSGVRRKQLETPEAKQTPLRDVKRQLGLTIKPAEKFFNDIVDRFGK